MKTSSPLDVPETDGDRLATIGEAERETGLSKDILRVWERRYGFPRPQRDANGERVYDAEQVAQLRQIRRLLDVGHRPGQVVGLELAALQALGDRVGADAGMASRSGGVPTASTSDEIAEILDILQRHDVAALRRHLGQAVMRMGLERFVCDLAAPLMAAVGSLWSAGRLQIFEEHLCSEVLESVLRQGMAGAIGGIQQQPRVLLSTLPDEPHRLGLLMAESLFQVHGCHCVNLGAQTPLRELRMACDAHEIQIVAMSLTTNMQPALASRALRDLRQLLPAAVQLWVGTRHAAIRRRNPSGVRVFDRLEAIGSSVRDWRQSQAARPFASAVAAG